MEQKTDIKKVMDQTHSLGMFWVLLAYPAVLLVKVYRFFSPIKQIILGPYAACRFHPTCSEYALECLSRFALPKAIYKSVARILRCNPMHPGGHDPVCKENLEEGEHE